MEDKSVVYIVDDSGDSPSQIIDTLSEYQTQVFNSSQTLIDELAYSKPNVIVLYVNPEGLDGFELCKKIKEDPATAQIPVLFISSLGTLEDKLNGYEAGADDYITKPYEPEEIKMKVASLIKRMLFINDVRRETMQSSVSAEDVITALSEHSIVLHYMQNILNCASYEQLANHLIDSCASLGVSIAIEFSVEEERQYFYTGDDENLLEKSVFNYIRDRKHVVDVGKRAAFNFQTMIILVHNMPVENAVLCGRLRDHMSVVGRATESKLLSLKKDMMIYEQRNELIAKMTALQQNIIELEKDVKTQQDDSRQIFHGMAIKMEQAFMSLDLTESEEEHIHDIIESSEKTFNDKFDADRRLENRLEKITTDIESALNQPFEEKEQPTVQDNNADDLEFF